MNTIAVWGAPGSGKSVVALAIAHQLTKQKKNVTVISADRVTPMLSTYLPLVKLDRDNSLKVFLNQDITKDNLRNKLHGHPKNQYLAFMALGEKDSYQSFKGNWSVTKLHQLLELLSDSTDVVVLDLTSIFMADNFTLWGLEKADKVISVANPDNRNTEFFRSYKPLLDNERKFDTTKHIGVLNNCYEYSPYERYMEENQYTYWLPHSYDVYCNYVSAQPEIFRGDDKRTKIFRKTIKLMVRKELSFE